MKPSLWAGIAGAAFVLAAPGAARADDAGSSRADAGRDLSDYYGGERLSAFLVGGMGVAAAGAGAYLATRDGDFARGLGWSWIALGGVEALGALAYAIQVGAEIDHYRGVLARDLSSYGAEESDHIAGTRSRFVLYRAIEAALVVGGAGAAAYGLAARSDAWTGAGVGVFSLAVPLAIVDTVNDARASRYLDQVRGLQPAVGVRTAAGTSSYVLSVGGVF